MVRSLLPKLILKGSKQAMSMSMKTAMSIMRDVVTIIITARVIVTEIFLKIKHLTSA